MVLARVATSSSRTARQPRSHAKLFRGLVVIGCAAIGGLVAARAFASPGATSEMGMSRCRSGACRLTGAYADVGQHGRVEGVHRAAGAVSVVDSKVNATGEGKSFMLFKVGNLDINATWSCVREHGDTADKQFQLAMGTTAARYSQYTAGGPGWTILHKRFEILQNSKTKATLVYEVVNPSALPTDQVAIPNNQISKEFDRLLRPADMEASELVDALGKHLPVKNIELFEAFSTQWKKYV